MKVRLQISPSNLSGRGFQFTHPWRCDSGEAHRRSNFPVSIHAPMKVRPDNFLLTLRLRSFNSRTHEGATFYCLLSTMCLCFNSRTHEGATWFIDFSVSGKMFQFTHPWRCDPDRQGQCPQLQSFNSRTREGATRFRYYESGLIVFQFTHPWRCDPGTFFHPRHNGF